MQPRVLRLGIPLVLALATLASPSPAGAAVGDGPEVIRFDGGGFDRLGAVTIDPAGNIYLAGSAESAGSDITFAVVKLSPQGRLLWRAQYGGALGGVDGLALAVSVDTAGNVYAAGHITDGVMFNTNYDYLVVKLSPDGVQRWAQRYDGPSMGFDQATELAVDPSGAVYVSGSSYGSGYDWVTHRFAADGSLEWTRRHSGPGSADDRVGDMVLAPNGNLVLTGFTKNTSDGLTNDVETITYDPLGSVVWQQRWSATPISHEEARAMDIDADGRIVVTGTTAESASPYAVPFPVTLRYSASGALLQVIDGEGAGGAAVDVDPAGSSYLAGSIMGITGAIGGSATAKYDAAGALVWMTPLTFEPSDAMFVTDIAVDSVGAVTVAGTVTDVLNLNRDYLVIRYTADGREVWRYRFNGTGDRDDLVAGLAIDTADAALVAGTSWSNYVSSGGTADDVVALRFAAGAVPPLSAPSALAATAVSGSQIQLRWQDNAGTETGFRIERCQGSGCADFAPIAAVDHDVDVYLDSGLRRNTYYSYRVQAFNGSGDSAFSNTDTTKTRPR